MAPVTEMTFATTTSTDPPRPTVADLFKTAVRQEVPIEGSAQSLTYHSDMVWVTRTDDVGDGSVLRLNAATGAIIDITAVDPFPTGPVFVDGAVWVFSVPNWDYHGI